MSFPASKVLFVCRAQRVFTSTGLTSLSLCPWNLLALTTAVPHFGPSLFLLCTHIFAFPNILPFQCTISMPLMLRQTQAIVFDRICWKWRQAGTCTKPSRPLSSMRSMVLPCLTPCPLLPSPRDPPSLAPLPPHLPTSHLSAAKVFSQHWSQHKCLSLEHVLVLVPQKVKSSLWKTNGWGTSQRNS